MAKASQRARFRPVAGKLDLAEVDNRVLDLWEREGTFNLLRKKNAGGPPFSFIDGPITANVEGMGVHSAWARTYTGKKFDSGAGTMYASGQTSESLNCYFSYHGHPGV